MGSFAISQQQIVWDIANEVIQNLESKLTHPTMFSPPQRNPALSVSMALPSAQIIETLKSSLFTQLTPSTVTDMPPEFDPIQDQVKSYVISMIASGLNNMALITVLPNEVLLMIFEEYLRASSPARFNPRLQMCDLVRLSHVSRAWRSIALCAPLLWTTIELCVPSTDMVSAFLDRSQACKLEIGWTIDDVNPDDGEVIPKSYKRNFRQAVKHISRWHRLHVDCSFVDHAEYVLAKIQPLDAVSLRHIRVEAGDVFELDNTQLDFHATPIATPALTSLDLGGTLPASFPNINSLSTLVLRELSLIFDNYPLTMLLSAASSLENLTIHGECIAINDHGLPVILHSLRNLRIFVTDEWDFRDGEDIEGEKVDYLARLTGAIVTPGLKALAIHRVTPSMFSHFCKSLPIESSKYPRLEYLELSSSTYDDDAALHLIRALPTIMHVSFQKYSADAFLSVLSDDVLDDLRGLTTNSLQCSARPELLWPRLQTITANYSYDDPVSEYGDSMYLLAKGRAIRGFPLPELCFFTDSGILDPRDDGLWDDYRELTTVKFVEEIKLELSS